MTTRNYSNIAVSTTLDGAINASVLTLDVDSATGYPTAPFTIVIGTEAILVGAVSSLTFSSLTRAYDGTTAASHADAAVVEHTVVAADYVASSAWTTYTPTWTAPTTNPVIGDGTLQGAYRSDGKTLYLRINLIMGSTTTFGSGDWKFGLPTSLVAKTGAQQTMLAHARDAGTAFYLGAARLLSAATDFEVSDHGGIRWNATTPTTWVNTDELEITGVVEVD